MILSNRSILLNSLSRVDDATEGITNDLGQLMHYVFVSSWTRHSEENIALWSMYTPNMAGVRIGLPEHFMKLDLDDSMLIKNVKGNIKNIYEVFSSDNVLPIDVEYVPNDEVPFTMMDVKSENSYNNWNAYLPKLGTRKSKLWKFQKETRFVLYAVPKKSIKKVSDSKKGDAVISLLQRPKTGLQSIEVSVDKTEFINMEIIIGPNPGSQRSYYRIVRALIDKYVPEFEGSIENSKVKVRNR